MSRYLDPNNRTKVNAQCSVRDFVWYYVTMKAFALVLVTISMTASVSIAQTNDVDFVRAMQARNASLKVHRTLMQRIFGMNVSYGNVLMPRSRIHHATTLHTNAPSQPFENVSVNPFNGRAEGLTLLSIHF